MPKLRKAQQQSQESQNIGKYLNFDDQETFYPEQHNQANQQQLKVKKNQTVQIQLSDEQSNRLKKTKTRSKKKFNLKTTNKNQVTTEAHTSKKINFEEIIFSNYTQDDSDKQQGGRMQSDVTQFDLLQKKKSKKAKKEKEVKIKNKYFSDIQLNSNEKNDQDENFQLQGQDPPQICQQLVIEKKQSRVARDLNKQISKRVNQVKDKRDFKNTQTDHRVKNQFRNKLQEIKDAEQVEIDVALPSTFINKTTSAALYIKNNIERQEKKLKSTKTIDSTQSIDENISIQSKQTPTVDNFNASKQPLSKNLIKKQSIMLSKNINKKKGIRRQDFFNNLTKEIKSQRHTDYNSQEMKDCFKKSSLQGTEIDFDIAQDIRSNGSSRSGSRDSIRSQNKQTRRQSIDSHQSRKSHVSIKSIPDENNNPPNDKHNQKSISLSKKIERKSSNWSMDFGQKNQQNSNSNGFFSNKMIRPRNIIQNPISEAKQSDGSSMSFNNVQIKQQVKKQFGESLKVFQSEQEKQKSIKNQKQNQHMQSIIQVGLHALQIKENLKKKGKGSKKQKQNKKQPITQTLQDLLNDGDQQSLKRLKKKNKNFKRSKRSKSHSLPSQFQDLFQIQAGYSSNQSGHTDEQNQLDQDIDIDGNVMEMLDYNQIDQNSTLVKKKFREDQEREDQAIYDRIMKGLYGRKKLQETDSEKRMRERMKQAAEKHKQEDDNQENQEIDKSLENQEKEQILGSQLQAGNHQDQAEEMERTKLKQLQEELNRGHHRHFQHDDESVPTVNKADTWKLIAAVLPVRKSIKMSQIPRSGIKKKAVIQRDKSGGQNNNKKSLVDLKNNNVQQEIQNRRITVDRNKIESAGNRNKLQKTGQIELDIRDKNIDLNQDIDI